MELEWTAAQQRQVGQILSSTGAVLPANLKDLHVSPSITLAALGVNPRSAGHEVQSRKQVRTDTTLSLSTFTRISTGNQSSEMWTYCTFLYSEMDISISAHLKTYSYILLSWNLRGLKG